MYLRSGLLFMFCPITFISKCATLKAPLQTPLPVMVIEYFGENEPKRNLNLSLKHQSL